MMHACLRCAAVLERSVGVAEKVGLARYCSRRPPYHRHGFDRSRHRNRSRMYAHAMSFPTAGLFCSGRAGHGERALCSVHLPSARLRSVHVAEISRTCGNGPEWPWVVAVLNGCSVQRFVPTTVRHFKRSRKRCVRPVCPAGGVFSVCFGDKHSVTANAPCRDGCAAARSMAKTAKNKNR